MSQLQEADSRTVNQMPRIQGKHLKAVKSLFMGVSKECTKPWSCAAL